MKMITKTFLNFIVCWSMLFTQAVNAELTGRNAKARELNQKNRRGEQQNLDFTDFNQDMSNLERSSMISGACRNIESIDFQLTGIDGLINHFRGQSCWENVEGHLGNLTENNGKASAVKVCNALLKVKEENQCKENSVMYPKAVESSLANLRQNPQLRELEVELKKKAFTEELDKAVKVSKLQALLSTDMNLVKFLYQQVKNAPEKDRAGFKEAYGIDDSFFSNSGNEMPLSTFAEKAFKCLEVPPAINTFINDPEQSCNSHGLAGEDSQSADILKDARDKFLADCNSDKIKDCSLKGFQKENLGTSFDVSDFFTTSVGDQIVNESDKFLNFGVLEDVPLDESLKTSRVVMDLFNQDRNEGPLNGQPRILNSVSEAVAKASTTEERLAAGRKAAMDHTLNLLVNDPNFPAADDSQREKSKRHFEEFVRHLAGDKGYLDLNGYNYDEIGERLLTFYESGKTNLRLFNENDADGKGLFDAVTYMTQLVRRVAIGQRVGDYVASKVHLRDERMKDRQRSVASQTSGQKSGFSALRQQTQMVLNNKNTQEAQIQAGQIVTALENSEVVKSFPVIGAAASMFASSSYNEGDLGKVSGYADIMKMFEQYNAIWDKNSNRQDSPLSKPQARHIAAMEFMANLALKSAQNCNDFYEAPRMKHRLCSPLSDAEYGISALENLMKDATDGRGDINTVNLALTYCSPIIIENKLRSLEEVGTPRDSITAHGAMNNICREQAGRLFCQGECSEDQVTGTSVGATLDTIFGPHCSHARADRMVSVNGKDDAETAYRNAFGGGPSTMGQSIFAGVDKRGKENSLRVGTRNYGPTPDNKVSVKDRVVSNSNSDRRALGSGTPEIATSKSINGNMASNQTSKNFMPVQAVMPTDQEEESLTQQLSTKKDALDPATKALLDRLEDMERRQTLLQEELRKSRDGGVEVKDDERDKLLAELAKLKKQIPELEGQIRSKKDVRTALAQPNPSSTPVSSGQTDFSRRSSRRPASTSSGSSRGNNASAPVQNNSAPASNISSGSFDDGGSVRTSSGVRSSGRSSGDGAGLSSGATSGASGGAVITMTQEIREKARVFDAGISPQEAVLQARGPVLIPQGDGEFMMYEPELTADGEVLTRDGEVVFKAVVRVSESEVPGKSGRVPASLDPEQPQVDPNYDPRRLHELDLFLNNLETGPILTPQ